MDGRISNLIFMMLMIKGATRKVGSLEKGLRLSLKHVRKNLARPTNLHLFFPAFHNNAFTNSSTYKPAEFPDLKLPGRTLCFLSRRTFFDGPTRFSRFSVFRN